MSLALLLACTTACPSVEELNAAAASATSDLAGEVTVREHHPGADADAASDVARADDLVHVDVEARNAAGDVVVRPLAVAPGDCPSAAALVAAVARRALLALPQPGVADAASSAPSGSSAASASTNVPDADAASTDRQVIAPRPIVVEALATPQRSSAWQLAFGAGGAVGFPLGGDARARAAVRATGSFAAEAGVDARIAVPIALGDGSALAATGLAVARLMPASSFAGDLALLPFVELGAGAVVVTSVGNTVDRTGSAPVAHAAMGFVVDVAGVPLQLSVEGALPGVTLSLDGGRTATLPLVRLALLVTGLADLADPGAVDAEGKSLDAGN